MTKNLCFRLASILTLVPIITVVINLSLSSGNMPSNLKEAILIPLIKKACLDSEIFNHSRPISNLTYLSKLIEKVVATRLFDHMTTNGLHEWLEYSYKKYHSTETALTCIHDAILRAVDEKQCVILLVLDLSVAFDTIDHDMLLSRLQKYIGLRDTPLSWFQSYMSQRQQSVLINGVKSKTDPLSCGVPQGSVLGPILFTIYLLPLGDIIRKHGFKFHMYADDCQLYTSFSMSTNEAVSSMRVAIDYIRAWYAANMLKMNEDKTEIPAISSKYRTIPKLLIWMWDPRLLHLVGMLETWVSNGHRVYYGTTYKQDHGNCFLENSPNFLLSKIFDAICC